VPDEVAPGVGGGVAGGGGDAGVGHLQDDQVLRDEVLAEVSAAAGILSRDVGGTATTEDVTKALIGALDA
jgi:hypothetical protein